MPERLLKTLIGVRAVRRSMVDQHYRNSIQLKALTHGMHLVDRLADVAAPWMEQLCSQVEWPSDLAIHAGNDDFMSVLESSLRQSRFYVRRSFGKTRVNLLASAAGGAFLFALTPQRRVALINAAREGRDENNARVTAVGDIEARAAQARERGFATRHTMYCDGSYNAKPRDDGLDAIAVPIVSGTWLLGAININWNRDALTEEEMVRRNLLHLRAAADGIAADAEERRLIDDLPGLERIR